MLKKHDYDAVVIGAGISGLICGCYLAKAGIKTLIVDKNAKPGGYCTSFTRNGFTFDACAHFLGSLRKEGNISKILKDLDLESNFKFTRFNPQDIIITPDYKISFWNDLHATIKEFQEGFPQESENIERFFNFLNDCTGVSFNSLKGITLQVLLDKYFKNETLKSIIAFPVFGNLGLPPSKMSAFTATTLYKEFVLDGGYYPCGGMQAFPDILAKRFVELKGDLLLSTLVTGIKIANNKAEGVTMQGSGFVRAKYVISNCDATETFSKLIEREMIDQATMLSVARLVPSLSAFIVYLGIDENLKMIAKTGSNIWFLPNYDIEEQYRLTIEEDLENLNWFLMRALPEGRTVNMLINFPFKNADYWKQHKKLLIDKFIEKMVKVVPDLMHHVVFKDAATPDTLYRWTRNCRGAAYGWESTPSQFAVPHLSQVTPVGNLYLTGHWATLAQGIPGVAYLGNRVAKLIMEKEKRQK